MKRFMQAIKMLRTESRGKNDTCSEEFFTMYFCYQDEKRMRKAKAVLKEKHHVTPLDEDECDFWTRKVKTTLGPIPEGLTKAVELKDGLKNLRNVTLVAMLLINLIWIVLFLTLTFEGLEDLNINPQLLILVFLAVYGVILLIQFVTMVIHRLITLSHYVARLNEELPVEQRERFDQTVGQSMMAETVRSVVDRV